MRETDRVSRASRSTFSLFLTNLRRAVEKMHQDNGCKIPLCTAIFPTIFIQFSYNFPTSSVRASKYNRNENTLILNINANTIPLLLENVN